MGAGQRRRVLPSSWWDILSQNDGAGFVEWPASPSQLDIGPPSHPMEKQGFDSGRMKQKVPPPSLAWARSMKLPAGGALRTGFGLCPWFPFVSEIAGLAGTLAPSGPDPPPPDSSPA